MAQEGVDMKVISLSRELLIGILAAVVIPACALESDMPDGSQTDDRPGGPDLLDGQKDDQASATDPATSTDTAALTLASFPTCNGVRDWDNAAVPDWNVTATVDCAMVFGTHSPAVGRLQRTMNVCYGEHLTVNNSFDTATQAALMRTQTKANTTPNGVYDPTTRKAIRHESNDIVNTCVRVN